MKRERLDTAYCHYVNTPADELKYDAKRDGRRGENVIDKLSEQAKVLADKSEPRAKRVEALKWVVHLVGDIHQPLHVTERGKDRGGNSLHVFYPGWREAVSLHFVWDTLVIRDMTRGTSSRPLRAATVASLALAILFAAAWARGRWSWRFEGIERRGAAHSIGVENGPFGAGFSRTRHYRVIPPVPQGWPWHSWQTLAMDFDTSAAFARESGGALGATST